MKRAFRLFSLLLCLACLCASFSALAASPAAVEPAELTVVFLDVGQGDCAILYTPNAAMLIDAGDSAHGNTVTAALEKLGITHLDYIVATHPHEDHIGGMEAILSACTIGKIIAPKVTHTSDTYTGFLRAVKKAGLKITAAKSLKTYDLDNSVSFILLAPVKNHTELNDNSVVLKVICGDISFLFAGDAETVSEKEMLSSQKLRELLPSTVLKVGHHGSTTSTSPAFAKAVSPSQAVISAGRDNSYGLPDSLILRRLTNFGTEVLRTDELGTILMTTDGKKLATDSDPEFVKAESGLSSTSEKGSSSDTSADAPASSYIGNRNSKKFHRPSCSTLPLEKNRIYFFTRADAVSRGYSPCGNCRP